MNQMMKATPNAATVVVGIRLNVGREADGAQSIGFA